MKITLVAGARPNFMKIAPIIDALNAAALRGKNLQYRLIHTGQHYDKNMSDNFFKELGIPEPDVNLESGGGTQAEQTAAIMVKFEKELLEHRPDIIIVVGDVTSTLACSIVAKKLCIDVAHVEAGIRSGDRTMPEEINRIVTDAITDYFFTTTKRADQNLINAGIEQERIFFVGNTMIDTLLKQRHRFRKPVFYDKLNLSTNGYIVLTLHRPANVDEEQKLAKSIRAIVDNVNGMPVIFPLHPRTAKALQSVMLQASNLYLTEPLSYLEFNYLVQNSKAVITDSGGVTEETTVMDVPCITLRDTTERPETIEEGTNMLVGTNPNNIRPALNQLLTGEWKKGKTPDMWDGKTSERIVEIIAKLYNA